MGERREKGVSGAETTEIKSLQLKDEGNGDIVAKGGVSISGKMCKSATVEKH